MAGMVCHQQAAACHEPSRCQVNSLQKADVLRSEHDLVPAPATPESFNADAFGQTVDPSAALQAAVTAPLAGDDATSSSQHNESVFSHPIQHL
jgi:hypothetical protein